MPLKAFLLDQRHLAGIGNIYADEILWWAGLSRRCGPPAPSTQRRCRGWPARSRGAWRRGCAGPGMHPVGLRRHRRQARDLSGLSAGLRQAGAALLRAADAIMVRVVIARTGDGLLSRLSALRGDRGERRAERASGGGGGTESEPRVHSLFVLSTALTSFPLRCTPRSFVSAFPLRVPFVSSSDDASELSGLCYVFYSRLEPSQDLRAACADGKRRSLRTAPADVVSASGVQGAVC